MNNSKTELETLREENEALRKALHGIETVLDFERQDRVRAEAALVDAALIHAKLIEERDEARAELQKTRDDFDDVWKSRDEVIKERERARQACNAYWHDLSRIGSLCEQTADEYPLKAVERTIKQFREVIKERDDARGRARRASQLLIEHVGSDGPMNVDEVAERAVKRVEELEAELAFIKVEYTDADPETLTRDALILQVNALKREREETEHQMHMRIRRDYDTTVADCWKAHCAKIEAERDKALEAISLILQTDALKNFAFERGDDDASIYEICKSLTQDK
jgi:chromosome segregation ATPase